ncbi:MAG: TylF/MycF/NovP-related O-methyltransferase [Bacteroidia bacterium]
MQQTEGDLFINKYPYKRIYHNKLITFINKVLFFLRIRYQLQPLPNPMIEMNTIEQRINFFHLLKSVLDFKVPGDIIEFGCYTGQCATLFQKVIADYDPDRKLLLFDSFEAKFTDNINVEKELELNFERAHLNKPILIKGRFEATVPQKLPIQIAFAHIDCGGGHEVEDHKKLILFLLNHIYPRLTAGAIVFFMDYTDKEKGHDVTEYYPGVKQACDVFFADKPESVIPLYGNQLPAGYVRKV